MQSAIAIVASVGRVEAPRPAIARCRSGRLAGSSFAGPISPRAGPQSGAMRSATRAAATAAATAGMRAPLTASPPLLLPARLWPSLRDQLTAAVAAAAAAAGSGSGAMAPAITQSKHADYQVATRSGSGVNASSSATQLALALQAAAAPALLARERGAVASGGGGGGGFVNLTLADTALTAAVRQLCTRSIALASGRGPPPPARPAAESVFVDFASPNMGKELHVGHLRSAVIGDSLARLWEHSGAVVERVSHVGDAGVPVALVVAARLLIHSREPSPPDWVALAQRWARSTSGSGDNADAAVHLSRLYTASKTCVSRRLTVADARPLLVSTTQGSVGASGSSTAAGDYEGDGSASWEAVVQATLRQLQRVLARLPMDALFALVDGSGCGGNVEAVAEACAAATRGAGPEPADGPTLADDGTVLAEWLRVCSWSRQGYAPLLQALHVDVREYGESAYVTDAMHIARVLYTAVSARDSGSGGSSMAAEAGAPGCTTAVASALQLALVGGTPSPAIQMSDGALVVQLPGSHSTGAAAAPGPPPFLLRKRDGGLLYSSIDMATLARRLARRYSRIIYVTDAAQAMHFRQLFQAAEVLGWLTAAGPESTTDGGFVRVYHNRLAGSGSHEAPLVTLAHAPFGVVTGESGKKLSSRDGAGEMTLAALLAEARSAVTAAAAPSSAPAMSKDEIGELAHAAVRYYDLIHARRSTYALSFARMTSLRGNTAAYVMYALTRLAALRQAALQDKGGQRSLGTAASWAECHALVTGRPTSADPDLDDASLGSFTDPAERKLALQVLRLPEAWEHACATQQPHLLADAVYSIATAFHGFYQACRVADAPPQDVGRRMQLCWATDIALQTGTHLLGCGTVIRM